MTSLRTIFPCWQVHHKEESQSFQWHHCLLLCKPKLKKHKVPKLSCVALFHQKNQSKGSRHCSHMQLSASVMHCLSFWSALISVLDSSACGEGYCVLAGQHMACLCLDTSYKQGLMSLLVQRHSGPSQDLSTSFTLQVYFEVSTVWMTQFVSTIVLHKWAFGSARPLFPLIWPMTQQDDTLEKMWKSPHVTRGLRALGYASSHPYMTLQQAFVN